MPYNLNNIVERKLIYINNHYPPAYGLINSLIQRKNAIQYNISTMGNTGKSKILPREGGGKIHK